MKRIFIQIALVLVLVASSCKGDKCNSISTKKTYMLCNEENSKSKKYIRLFVNEQTYLLGDTNFSLFAKDMEIENGDIYVLATKTNLQNFVTENVVFKNNDIIKSIPSTNSFIPTALSISGTDIFIAGTGQENGSMSKLKLWKNGNITNLTQGISTNITCNDMLIDNGDIYIAGSETLDSSEIKVGKYWKNGNPIELEQNSEVKRIIKSGNNIYCSGISNGFPSYWTNGVLSSLGKNRGQCVGISIENNQIYALVSSQINDKFQTSIWNNQSESFLTDVNSHPNGSFGTELIKNSTDLVAAGGVFNTDETVSPVIWTNGKLQLMPYTSGTVSFISKIIYK